MDAYQRMLRLEHLEEMGVFRGVEPVRVSDVEDGVEVEPVIGLNVPRLSGPNTFLSRGEVGLLFGETDLDDKDDEWLTRLGCQLVCSMSGIRDRKDESGDGLWRMPFGQVLYVSHLSRPCSLRDWIYSCRNTWRRDNVAGKLDGEVHTAILDMRGVPLYGVECGQSYDTVPGVLEGGMAFMCNACSFRPRLVVLEDGVGAYSGCMDTWAGVRGYFSWLRRLARLSDCGVLLLCRGLMCDTRYVWQSLSDAWASVWVSPNAAEGRITVCKASDRRVGEVQVKLIEKSVGDDTVLMAGGDWGAVR